MRPRWIGVMWMVSAAATLGLLAAGIAGGTQPPPYLVVLFIGLPAAVTLVRVLAGMGTMGRQGGTSTYERYRRDSYPRVSSKTLPAIVDWEEVEELSGALQQHEVAWLRSTDFVRPWLDVQPRKAISLKPLVAELLARPFDSDIDSALRALSAAIAAFDEYYERHAVPDPLLVKGDWRFFEWVDLDSTGPVADQAARLRGLAARLADAYETFVNVVAQYEVSGRSDRKRANAMSGNAKSSDAPRNRRPPV